ncbi:MAG: amino acid ABC transporter permease [Ktedonobacterales bacterium]
MQYFSRLRSSAVSALLAIIFLFIAVIFIGALEKSQLCSSYKTVAQIESCKNESLIAPGNLLHYNALFFQSLWNAITVGTNNAGIPYHNLFLSGLGLTIEFCFISMPLAIALGLILALMSRSKFDILRIPARSFVEFFRNTPLLVQLVAIYTGLAFLPQSFVNAFTAGVATLVLNYGAYECENLRAGIDALDRGQGEAAASLGFRRMQTLQLIEIPQMIPIVLPPIINDLIYMYKDSSILSLITIQELTAQTQTLARQHPATQWQFYFIGGGIYLLLSLPLGRLARVVEARVKSLRFNSDIDTTTVAMEVLVASIIFGVIAGLLVVWLPQGFSLSTLGTSLANLVAAIALAAALTAGVALTLGLIIYIASKLLRLLRGRNSRDETSAHFPQNGGGGGDVDMAAAMSSSDL